jgi:hypothetical protein
MDATIAQSYLMTLGVLPRMRLLACGWTNPGDRFRSPMDAAWWSAPYGRPLWEPLLTYARAADAVTNVGPLQWDATLALGDAGALSHALSRVASELEVIHAAGHDVCAPFLIPTLEGVLPQPGASCLTRLGVTPVAKQQTASTPTATDVTTDVTVGPPQPDPSSAGKKPEPMSGTEMVVVAAGVFALMYKHKHGRWPWQ